MNVITDIYNCSPKPCAVTIGSFDGVHLGHRAMLEELRRAAQAKGLPVTVVTFARHPRLLFDGSAEPFLLSGNAGKEHLLSEAGIDNLVLLDFDTLMASMTAERFMKEILVERIGARLLAVGYDHHFGKPCEGEGIDEYISYGKRYGVEVFQASPFAVDGFIVSSSAVRRALSAGKISLANAFLGRPYNLQGKVIHCTGIGRSIGFPTANIAPDEEMQLLPANGVYGVCVTVGGMHYKGVMNIGVKPTVTSSGIRTIEVHIMDFADDIYGCSINVEVLQRIREERPFDSLDALREQIEADVVQVREMCLKG